MEILDPPLGNDYYASIPAKSVHGMFQAVIPKKIILTREFCVEVIQLDKTRCAIYNTLPMFQA